jgi:hypothetical protein
VYNGTNRLPFGNDLAGGVSGIRSRGLAGDSAGHEISWDDRPGVESLVLRADGLMVADAAGDMRLSSGVTTTIQTAASRTDEIGDDFSTTVGGSSHRRVGKAESAIIAGDQKTRIGGARQDEVVGDHTSLVGDGVIHRIGGSRATFVGSAAGGHASDTLAINGHYRVATSGGLTLTSNETIHLCVGSSSIRLEPERIIVMADEVLIQGRERISAAQGENEVAASLVLEGSASLAGGEVFAASGAGAKLHLEADAHLDGALVKLNCGSGSGGGAELVDSKSEAGSAVVRLDRRFLEGTGYTLVVQMPDGTMKEHPIEPGGEVVLEGNPGDRFMIVEVRRGETPVAVRREDK